MVQEYLNEISPTIYGPNKPKTSGKPLRIPDLQTPAANHDKPATLYIYELEKACVYIKAARFKIGFAAAASLTLSTLVPWLSSGWRSFIMDAPQIECHDIWYYSLSVSCIQDIIPFACLVILFLVSIIVYWLPNDSLMLTAPISCLSIMQESSQCRQQCTL